VRLREMKPLDPRVVHLGRYDMGKSGDSSEGSDGGSSGSKSRGGGESGGSSVDG